MKYLQNVCRSKTVWLTPDTARAYQFIEKKVAAGHQAYVICPLVEESENMEAENVAGDYAKRLKEELPDTIEIGLLHGQMKPAQKNDVMERFAQMRYRCSSTDCRIGVNVPNATVMMIENAEHFGLHSFTSFAGVSDEGCAVILCVWSIARTQGHRNVWIFFESINDGFKITK